MPPPNGRILFVEDDPDSREVTEFVLRDAGFEIVCAENAAQTIDFAKTQSFDLYLMDNWLEDLSGPQLTAKLREFDSSTPILFFSAASFEEDKRNAFKAGAQAYLVKPAEREQLLAEVTGLIAKGKAALGASS
jgi:DNA-binding response OmpR family regulator